MAMGRQGGHHLPGCLLGIFQVGHLELSLKALPTLFGAIFSPACGSRSGSQEGKNPFIVGSSSLS